MRECQGYRLSVSNPGDYSFTLKTEVSVCFYFTCKSCWRGIFVRLRDKPTCSYRHNGIRAFMSDDGFSLAVLTKTLRLVCAPIMAFLCCKGPARRCRLRHCEAISFFSIPCLLSGFLEVSRTLIKLKARVIPLFSLVFFILSHFSLPLNSTKRVHGLGYPCIGGGMGETGNVRGSDVWYVACNPTICSLFHSSRPRLSYVCVYEYSTIQGESWSKLPCTKSFLEHNIIYLVSNACPPSVQKMSQDIKDHTTCL